MPRRRTSHPDSRPLDPTLDFLRLLWSIEHNLQSTSKMMRSRLGITGPQRLVLRVIAQFPGISAKDVAHLVRLHPSTVTGILQRLQRKRLVLRAYDPIDTRRVRLRVLASARRFIRPSPETAEHAVERALRRLPAASVDAARTVLAAIATSLESHRR
jgi:DNA-binding MarR family transcriptional regulator